MHSSQEKESTVASTHTQYRPDIDGLRAIAVAAVVGFHAFPKAIMSGFVGVDIFFVISGYLISRIIFSGLRDHSFRFSTFYGRRIRRILPALLVVLTATYVFGWFALFPEEFKQLGRHIAAGAGFLSNVVLLNDQGYFNNASETKPLLHLWSLGIEEQFYIIWPLLLWGVYKIRRASLVVIFFLFTASFVINLTLADTNPAAAFYLPQARFWQLLLGSMIAWGAIHTPTKLECLPIQKMFFSHVLSLIGAALIVISVLIIPQENFPGWWAALPTLGAACLITAGANAWFNRCVLSNRVLIGIGLISYPLYLWHWPIISYAHIIESDTPSYPLRIFAIALSVLLATLTYHLVERPIRRGVKFRHTVPWLMALLIGIGFAGYAGYIRDGIPSRVPTRTTHPIATTQVDEQYWEQTKFNNFFQVKPIVGRDYLLDSTRENGMPTVAFLGDSHANRLFLGTREFSTLNLINIGRGTCPPFIDVDVEYMDGKKLICQPLVNRYLRYVKERDDIDIILLTAHYSKYGRDYMLISNERRLSVAEALDKTIAFLSSANKPIIIIPDVPEVPLQCYEENSARSVPVWSNVFDFKNCTIPKEGYTKSIEEFKSTLTKTPSHVLFFSPYGSLCDEHVCGEIDVNNRLYKYDGHHVNDFGIREPGKVLSEFLDRLVSQDDNATP